MATNPFRKLMLEALESRDLMTVGLSYMDGQVMGQMFPDPEKGAAEVGEAKERTAYCRQKLEEVLGKENTELGLLLAQGYSLRQIAEMTGVSHMSVRRHIDKADAAVDEVMKDYSLTDFWPTV
jgi:DNA-directed RNA polymerase specialized sigma24 family protein